MKLHIFVAALLLLAGCDSTVFTQPGTSDDPALYASIYPYYIEICAVSGVKKRPGFGFEYQSGTGGHAVMYLNGVCRDRDTSYPIVRMCDDTGSPAESGVGLSANGHFSNAAWVATPGGDFFFDGAVPPGESVNKDSYRRTQARAKQLGVLNGVRFHDEVFEDIPPGMTRDEFKYEVSIATDYGISLGRGRLCARLPVNRPRMQRVVAYLNSENALYRDGPRTSTMTVLTNNCSHFTHNVLAEAGLWDTWPTDRFLLLSALSFPVPKNEFVNQMVRSNDLPLDDPIALFRDPAAHDDLLRDDALPAGPGAIATRVPIRTPNELYDADVNLIFYDVPILGWYPRQLDRIDADRRFTDLAENLRYFAEVYARIDTDWKPPEWWIARAGPRPVDIASFRTFYQRYHDYVERMNDSVRQARSTIERSTGLVALAAGRPASPSGKAARVAVREMP